MALGSTQPLTEMSTRSRRVRLTTLPPSCAVVMKSGNLNFLEPSGLLQACNGIALPFYTSVLEVAFATCNLTALCLRRYGACNLGCCVAERCISSPCVCSSGQTYSKFVVRTVMRMSCPEFPNLCTRTLCSLTMGFQMFMHRLFQITSSDVNYT